MQRLPEVEVDGIEIVASKLEQDSTWLGTKKNGPIIERRVDISSDSEVEISFSPRKHWIHPAFEEHVNAEGVI